MTEANRFFDALGAVDAAEGQRLVGMKRVALTRAAWSREEAYAAIGAAAGESDGGFGELGRLEFGGTIIVSTPMETQEGMNYSAWAEAERIAKNRGWGEKVVGVLDEEVESEAE